MFLGADESSKIMRDSSAALVKNRGRRVTVAGGEIRDPSHPKRAKKATADDDNGVFFLFVDVRELCAHVVGRDLS